MGRVQHFRSRDRKPALCGTALRNEIRRVVDRHLDRGQYDVFLFGSEASGVAVPGSDVDIGIWGPEPVPGTTLERIRQELETLRTLRPFDVVDFARTDERFQSVALREIERLSDEDT